MRSVGRWIVAAAALFAPLCAAVPARAIEVNCLEASRYKYIMRIFGNDTNRFAAFFRANPQQLPNPETCRALVITGPVEALTRESRERGDGDFQKLAGAISNGRGWVSTLYLSSPGGNIATGLRLGELTRMFWLNTSAVEDGKFEYVPDFLGPAGPGSPVAAVPAEFEAGWRDYQAATQGFSRLASGDRRSRRCASSCTFTHTAGIYRYGTSYYHRGRSGKSDAQGGNPSAAEPSMMELVERLQHTENRIVAFYRKMDAGDQAIAAFQSTASETTIGAPTPLMPRYIGDYLKKECAPRGDSQSTKRASQRNFPDGFADIQCLAASNSRERLLQFAKHCPNGCDIEGLLKETGLRVRALIPDDPASKKDEPQRPRAQGAPYGQQSYPPGGYPGMR